MGTERGSLQERMKNMTVGAKSTFQWSVHDTFVQFSSASRSMTVISSLQLHHSANVLQCKICCWHWLYKLVVIASFLFREAIYQWLKVAVKTGSIAQFQIIVHPQPSCKSARAVYVVESIDSACWLLLMRTLTCFLACSISLYPHKVKTKWEHFLTLSHKQL